MNREPAPPRRRGRIARVARWCAIPLAACLGVLATAPTTPLRAQVISGRVLDAQNGAPIGLAAIIVLDADRRPLMMRAAELDGRYRLEMPGPGEYYVVVERLGYFENESPLLAVGESGEFGLDLEMRPEPIRLDPLEVTVVNERLEDFLTLEFGRHPASIPGYRSIQGIRLEEAKLKAEDNTDVLRWLYVPVSHGARVCIGTFGAALPGRTTYDRTVERARPVDEFGQCGALFLNGYRCRNEHIEEIDMDRIGVVVAFRASVHLYTRDFDFTFDPGRGGAGC